VFLIELRRNGSASWRFSGEMGLHQRRHINNSCFLFWHLCWFCVLHGN